MKWQVAFIVSLLAIGCTSKYPDGWNDGLACIVGGECEYCPGGIKSSSCYTYHCNGKQCFKDNAPLTDPNAATTPSPSNPVGPHCQGGLSCSSLAANCGNPDDGCNTSTTLNCGESCPSGETCDPYKYQCGACNPATCLSLGVNCGTVSDGCGGTIDCDVVTGGCPVGEICGGSGVPNQCGCTPLTCQQGQVTYCSPTPDGCGGTLVCNEDTCASNQICLSNGTCGTVECVPNTCADQNNPCGPVSDGCGGTLNCGTCAAGQICDRLSLQCESFGTSDTLNGSGVGSPACDGQVCGYIFDACRVPHSCGGNNACGSSNVCVSGRCEACVPTTVCPPNSCSKISDGCGGTLDCTNNPPIGGNGSGGCSISGQICDKYTGTCTNGIAQTCEELGANCGNSIPDLDNGLVNCGICPGDPESNNLNHLSSCGGGGQNNVCGYTPLDAACAAAGATCGTAFDACGNPFVCGTCPGGVAGSSGNKCVNGNSCVACQAADFYTCTGHYANACGTGLSDNCGNFINCGCGTGLNCAADSADPNTPPAAGVTGTCVPP